MTSLVRFALLAASVLLLGPASAQAVAPANALEANAGRIAAGAAHTCAIKTDGTPICWGNNDYGQATIPDGIGTVTAIAAAANHTCVIKTSGIPACWGPPDYGEEATPDGIGTVTAITTSSINTCVIKTDGTPMCWGATGYGRTTIPDGTGTVTAISPHNYQTCVIKTDGTPVCWGDDSYGESSIPEGTGTVTAIVAGYLHGCAIKTDGTPVCWGFSGYGSTTIPDGIGTLATMTTNGYETCAIKTDGNPVCWASSVPGDIGTVTAITKGDSHACAIKTDGTPVCWGDNDHGQITIPAGIGTVSARPPAPALASVTPQAGTTPIITGSSWADTTITLYAGTTCSGSVIGSGTASDLAGAGITATVPAEAVSAISATATDVTGNASNCSNSLSYSNVTPPPPAPTLSVVTPDSGTTPKVTGTSSADTTITLYAGTTCSGPAIGTGSDADFGAAGITATVPAEAVTAISATATDQLGHISDCSNSLSYSNVTPPPSAVDPPAADLLTPTLTPGPPTVLAPTPCTTEPAAPKAKKSPLALRVSLTKRGLAITAKARGKVTVIVTRQAPCSASAALTHRTIRATGRLKLTVKLSARSVSGTLYSVTMIVGKKRAVATVTAL